MLNQPKITKHIAIMLLLIFVFYIVAFAQSAIVGTYIDLLEQNSTPTAGQIANSRRLFIDTSGNMKLRKTDGTLRQFATGDQAVSTTDNPTFAGATIGSGTGYAYLTNGVVSTPHTGTPTVTLGSDWTNDGYNGASISLASGSNDLRGFIYLSYGAGRAEVQTITVNSNPAVNDTLRVPTTINYTFISGASSGNNIQIGADTTTTATNIAARINAQQPTQWTATSSGNIVTLTQVITTTIGDIVSCSQTVGATLSFAITTHGIPTNNGSSVNTCTLTFSTPYSTTPLVYQASTSANQTLPLTNILGGASSINTTANTISTTSLTNTLSTLTYSASKGSVIYYQITQ